MLAAICGMSGPVPEYTPAPKYVNGALPVNSGGGFARGFFPS